MSGFSDYIVYVDESGDHSLTNINPDYPQFVLAFCIFPIASYINSVVPAVERLKFEHFGHDMVVLHEHEIRKSLPPFQILLHGPTRASFLSQIDQIMTESDFTVVATVIRKAEFRQRRGDTVNPYEVALEFGLERVYMHLQDKGQRGRPTKVVFEGRGRKEDNELELAFRRIMDTTSVSGMADTLEFLCANKQANSSGLQIADMVARPIGIHDLRPTQSNHAWDVIEPKLRRNPMTGSTKGWGLKVYP
ncbi:MAG: DUF3800 domain-containing protein [Actinobacteria bacterium HGW-Actinobacteria-4]|nr:MAG: DUF3800 domain-containing protein [Actinobacteria bacterium HGW-Actinobacteria-4]